MSGASVEPTIKCPKCHAEIRLTEAVAGPLVASARREFEQRLANQEQAAERALAAERPRIEAQARERAQDAVAAEAAARARELAELQDALRVNNGKLATAQAAQAQVERERRELEDQRREVALTVERQVAAGVATARAAARSEAEATVGLRVAERDEQIASMSRVIDELRRKAEQGSQQAQGEAQELVLETVLRERWPRDAIEAVAKGQFGGDVLHGVADTNNRAVGLMLWELKRTKSWSDGWLAKLRADGRAAKADVLILASHTMPNSMDNNPRGFDLIDGVWVCHVSMALCLAAALREGLLATATARAAAVGQETKAGAMYTYLTGAPFRLRVEAMVEAFTTMRRDLDAERTAVTRLWAKREQQLLRASGAISGMYGDLQGIAGSDAGELAALALPAIEGPA